MQFISNRHEIPEEMEVIRDDRQQLAEITIEYPTRKSNQEQTRQEIEQKEQKIHMPTLQTSLQPAAR